METIKVCIVEDDPEFREWLLAETAETGHIKCLGCFSPTGQALAQIPTLNPDVVLMDLVFDNSDIDGPECM